MTKLTTMEKNVYQPVTQQANQPANQPTSQPASQSANQLASQPANQAASQSISQPSQPPPNNADLSSRKQETRHGNTLCVSIPTRLGIQAVQPASQPASQPVSQSAKPASQQASDELAIRLVNPASCGPACIGAINKRSAMALELARLKELLLTSTLV
ncbi:hypothetical protein HZH68_008255 [Vespula germanica]|uniref:Uncharacterized protein n=1 Tax=Vespula germanica TaxID=30212 RepID=A0A834N9W2_VESGE|nr:hypothetical protein HZH68_008255 [Vespula germanica]